MSPAAAPVLVAAILGLVVLLLGAERRESAAGKWATKPLASLAFCLLALGQYSGAEAWHAPMLAGFALCWLGDVLLIPSDKRIFLAGIGAFLLGHVGFAAAFLVRGIDPVWAGASLAFLGPAGLVVWRWLRGHLSGVMAAAVPAYIVVICAMVALALGAWGAGPGGEGASLVVGATLFWLSDLCVARNRFVQPAFVNRLVGLPLYYGAVTILALAPAAEAWAARTLGG